MRVGKQSLVKQLQLQNEKAVELLITEHGERLITIIRKHLFTLPHLQQDCLVDTIQAIWNHAEYFHENNEFENWIGSVARYCCLEYLRNHKQEATIAWLIEKEIAEEKEVMTSCLEPEEQKLFYQFYTCEENKSTSQPAYHNMYELLNRIDTDIFEYEKEPLSMEEQKEVLSRIQIVKKDKKRRFSLKRYLEHSFRKTMAVNC